MSDVSILAPIAITDAMLVSSTAAENDYAAWNSSATYVMGNRVISTITHRIYESAQAGNNNKDPTNIINRAGTVIWWIDLGPTNQRAMFDGLVSTQTSVASPLTVVLRAGVFNAFFLGGLDADAISYVVKDAPGGTVISSYSGVLEGSTPADYYEFFFERFKPQTDFIASSIPEYHAAELTLTLTKVTGNVKLGILAIGDLQPFAPAQYGVKVKPKTWSYIKVDDSGNATIKKRRSGKDITVNALVELDDADTVLDAITFVLDVPCVMICSDAVVHRGMRGFGLVSGELSYDHKTKCNLTLTQQGLI
ncbi:MAG: hypothetical protein WA071_00105 [Undibacterium umbellatum]|uniref:hypothetical protein n=1 Tax=Undibacterium umbellatum TaxID=2762300 RepID=UPI003BB6A029